MPIFEFTIVASGLDPTTEDFEARFYDAGCDDATISFQRGRILVDFAREADSVVTALSSAAEGVVSAGATIDRIEPDPLVSLSDIASRAGITRAAVTQYAKGQRGRDFPPPVARVTADGSLWDWAGVAQWLFRNERLTRSAVIEAEAVRQANAALAAGRQRFGDDLRRRVDEVERSL